MLLTAGVASAKYFFRHMLRQNSVTQARRNISQHYDLVWLEAYFNYVIEPNFILSQQLYFQNLARLKPLLHQLIIISAIKSNFESAYLHYKVQTLD